MSNNFPCELANNTKLATFTLLSVGILLGHVYCMPHVRRVIMRSNTQYT